MKRPYDAVSPSELSTYNRCQRLWAAKYVSDQWPLARGDTGNMRLGSAYHSVCDKYLAQGIIPTDPSNPLTTMFLAALPYLPKPFTGRVEHRFTRTIGGVPYQGRLDWQAPGHIIDHKTSKDPQRYGLRAVEDKLSDEQTVIYCAEYIADRDSIVFDHIYVRPHKEAAIKFGLPTTGRPDVPSALPSPVTLHREQLSAVWEPLVGEPSARLYSIRTKGKNRDPKDFPMPENLSVCDEFGGCPCRSTCHAGLNPFTGADLI